MECGGCRGLSRVLVVGAGGRCWGSVLVGRCRCGGGRGRRKPCGLLGAGLVLMGLDGQIRVSMGQLGRSKGLPSVFHDSNENFGLSSGTYRAASRQGGDAAGSGGGGTRRRGRWILGLFLWATCRRPVRSCAVMGARGGKEGARRPVSRVLSAPCGAGRPFLWDASRDAPHATNPDGGTGMSLRPMVSHKPRPSLFGLAPGGVYRAAPVARGAVRSYRTVSPLPAGSKG